RRPCRTEDRDAVRDMRQVFKALDKLAHDAKNAPGIGVEKFIGARRLEQLLILCAAVWFLTGITVGHCYPRLSLQSAVRIPQSLDSHYVVATIDVDRFAGNARRQRATEKRGCVSHFARFDVAP